MFGFRYRIIFLLLAFGYSQLINTEKFQIKAVIRWSCIVLTIILVINFISINRQLFRSSSFDAEKISVEAVEENYLLKQTNNFSTDFIVLQYMEKNHIEHDYGLSMFGHIFIRFTPSSFYHNNVKPTIPQLEIVKNSFGSLEGYYSGSAVSNVFQYYIGFGYFGVVFFMMFQAVVIAYISKKRPPISNKNKTMVIICSMVIFQEVTRGYLPQVMTHFIYLLIPLLFLYRTKKNDCSIN